MLSSEVIWLSILFEASPILSLLDWMLWLVQSWNWKEELNERKKIKGKELHEFNKDQISHSFFTVVHIQHSRSVKIFILASSFPQHGLFFQCSKNSQIQYHVSVRLLKMPAVSEVFADHLAYQRLVLTWERERLGSRDAFDRWDCKRLRKRGLNNEDDLIIDWKRGGAARRCKCRGLELNTLQTVIECRAK